MIQFSTERLLLTGYVCQVIANLFEEVLWGMEASRGDSDHFFPIHIADSDYTTTTIMLTFTPSGNASLCSKIQIIDDDVDGEPSEEFSVKLISASPVGTIGEDTSCVTITDNDRK